MAPDYNTLAYPHSQHRRYVRGCEACLQRTKAGQRRYTESRRRTRRNQCDGCCAGRPLHYIDGQPYHMMGDPLTYADMMACQRERYVNGR